MTGRGHEKTSAGAAWRHFLCGRRTGCRPGRSEESRDRVVDEKAGLYVSVPWSSRAFSWFYGFLLLPEAVSRSDIPFGLRRRTMAVCGAVASATAENSSIRALDHPTAGVFVAGCTLKPGIGPRSIRARS